MQVVNESNMKWHLWDVIAETDGGQGDVDEVKGFQGGPVLAEEEEDRTEEQVGHEEGQSHQKRNVKVVVHAERSGRL